MAGFGLALLLPALVAAVMEDTGTLGGLVGAAGTALFLGVVLVIATQGRSLELTRRDGVIVAAAAWLTASVFAALPFFVTGTIPDFAGAYFEAMSGLTTTGLTVLADPEILPDSLLLWRAMLQGIGGAATIVFAFVVLPFLGIGGLQRFETGSAVRVSENLRPRLRHDIPIILAIYLVLVLVCTVLLWETGLPFIDAVCLALGTVSTGGFSTHAGAAIPNRTFATELVLIAFMLIGAINFVIHSRALRGKLLSYWFDPEVRMLVALTIGGTLAIGLTFWSIDNSDALGALRNSIFLAVSAVTTTGYRVDDSVAIPMAGVFAILAMTMVGGSTGSTAGGLKALRANLLLRQGAREMVLLTRPHGIVPIKYGGATVSAAVVQGAWGFFAAFLMLTIVITFGLAMTGLEFADALSLAVSGVTNAGPVALSGAGESHVLLAGTGAKWLIVTAMLLGRLEVMALLVLLSSRFWRD